jgi:hypothetical protein
MLQTYDISCYLNNKKYHLVLQDYKRLPADIKFEVFSFNKIERQGRKFRFDCICKGRNSVENPQFHSFFFIRFLSSDVVDFQVFNFSRRLSFRKLRLNLENLMKHSDIFVSLVRSEDNSFKKSKLHFHKKEYAKGISPELLNEYLR